MDDDMIIEALKEELQALENIKTEVAEQQEEIRKTITMIQFMREGQKCDSCRKDFPEDELIETEFGFLCQDCFRDRMDIEDKNINE